MAKKKKKKKTIGEMSNTRAVWSINPTTKVKDNNKGKGSYKRIKMRKGMDY